MEWLSNHETLKAVVKQMRDQASLRVSDIHANGELSRIGVMNQEVSIS